MKTDTMLLIAGAVGIALLVKKNKEKTAALAATAPAAAAARIAALPEPGGSAVAEPEVVTGPEPTEIYERVGRGGTDSWAPSWGSLHSGGRRGRSR